MWRWLAVFGIFCAWGAVAAESPANAWTGSRVVILSGLPGDLESARDYERRVAAALDLLAAAGVAPSAIHLLVDDPAGAVPGSFGKSVVPRKANRENFLALGKELGTSSAPVTVIAWGHGGMVRGAPVLHVGGPRITQEDFVEFARAAGAAGAPLREVLFFPGSGAVARALTGARREILSSENEVAFLSDPIGIDLLLADWTKNPAASLDEVGRVAGPRIAKWYDDRHLARTEEPTLFLNEAPAVLLAEVKPPAEAPPATPEPRTTTRLETVHPVDTAAYPGSDAVVLDQDVSYTLGESPAVQADIDEVVQILTPEGKQEGDFDLEFSPPGEDVEFVALEVRKPDGTVVTLDPEKILDSGNTALPGYEASHRKVFSLPGVSAGAILHVHYRRIWQRFPFPHVFLELPIGGGKPVRHSRLRVELARGRTLHHAIADGAAQEPVRTASTYGETYEWTWSDVPALHREMLAEPGREPRVQLSTFPDWRAFADWYGRLIREADEITDDLRAKAKDLTRDAKSPEEKVKAIYEYVTALRYVSIPLGVNSYRPHAAANVLRNGFGDCKDKANLLNTLCRAVGIEAKLVLVPRFGQANAAVPGLAFNHAISRVELPDGPLWLDSTDDVCPFGMLPPGDPGRDVLVIDGTADGLARLPAAEPRAHGLEVRFDIAADGGASLEMSARGYAGYRLREAAREADRHAGTLPMLTAAGLLPTSGLFVSEGETHSSPAELDGPFSWRASGRWIALPATGAPFVLPAEWREALQPRTQPLFLNAGFPVSLVQTARRRWAADSGAAGLPPSGECASGPLQWRLTWRREGDSVVGELRVEVPVAVLDQAATARFQRELARLYATLAGRSEPALQK
jgi:hypothetical protein